MSKTAEEIEKEKQEQEKVKNAEAVLAKNQELLEENRKLKEAKQAEETEKKRLQEEKLASEKNYAELARLREEDAKAEKAKREELERNYLNEKKNGALSIELDKLGVIAERKAVVLSLANMSAIQYLEATKTLLGAEAEAKRIQAMAPEMFGQKQDRLPNGQGGNSNSAHPYMSDEWYSALSRADKDKYYKEYMESKGIKIRK